MPRRASGQGGVSRSERWLYKKLLAALGHPPIEVVLWNGETVYAPQVRPVARVSIHDRRVLWQLLSAPDLGFGDGYSAGLIDVEGDLVEFNIAVHKTRLAAQRGGLSFAQLVSNWFLRPRRNTLASARENIHHHYDLGNHFYQMWLDEQLLYTCAYFPEADATLEEAQVAKMDLVCRKLRLKPGQTVVEAGCGWGALARHMAKYYGVQVKAFNISHEQIIYARERAQAEGLAKRVEYIEADYRDIRGTFDVFASVGMLEHVGTEHYRALGGIIRRCLKPEGLALIHSIARNKAKPNSTWIEKRLFPGSYPPSLREMMEIFEPNQFSILDVENLRLHYAKTLQHWLARFREVEATVQERYDEHFVRAWRLYLAGSVAGFTTSSLQLFQVVFTHANNNYIPWNREDIYRGSAKA